MIAFKRAEHEEYWTSGPSKPQGRGNCSRVWALATAKPLLRHCSLFSCLLTRTPSISTADLNGTCRVVWRTINAQMHQNWTRLHFPFDWPLETFFNNEQDKLLSLIYSNSVLAKLALELNHGHFCCGRLGKTNANPMYLDWAVTMRDRQRHVVSDFTIYDFTTLRSQFLALSFVLFFSLFRRSSPRSVPTVSSYSV